MTTEMNKTKANCWALLQLDREPVKKSQHWPARIDGEYYIPLYVDETDDIVRMEQLFKMLWQNRTNLPREQEELSFIEDRIRDTLYRRYGEPSSIVNAAHERFYLSQDRKGNILHTAVYPYEEGLRMITLATGEQK